MNPATMSRTPARRMKESLRAWLCVEALEERCQPGAVLPATLPDGPSAAPVLAGEHPNGVQSLIVAASGEVPAISRAARRAETPPGFVQAGNIGIGGGSRKGGEDKPATRDQGGQGIRPSDTLLVFVIDLHLDGGSLSLV